MPRSVLQFCCKIKLALPSYVIPYKLGSHWNKCIVNLCHSLCIDAAAAHKLAAVWG